MKTKLKEFIIRNNKILLLVVGVLLVLTISISFAYFTGRADYYAKKVELVETTAIIEGEKVIVNGNLSFNDFDILPGHKNISELKVSSNEITSPVFFNLIWNGINNLNTPLNFYVYKTESEIDTGATCEKIKKNIDGTIRYYEECSIKNETLLGEAINTGTISKSDTEAKVNLLNDEYITSEENERYYYVVLEYPNLDESQNEDIGGNFSGKVTAEAGDSTKRLIYVNVENGSTNPNKKIVTVGATENFTITPKEHYDTSSATVVCTNNTSATLSDNTLTLSNITNNDTCTVSMPKFIYNINLSVTNGTGSETTTLSGGDSKEFTITPNSGYTIKGADVIGDNCNLSGNTLSINNISDNVNCNINIKNSEWSRYNVASSTTYYWNRYYKVADGTEPKTVITEESGTLDVSTLYMTSLNYTKNTIDGYSKAFEGGSSVYDCSGHYSEPSTYNYYVYCGYYDSYKNTCNTKAYHITNVENLGCTSYSDGECGYTCRVQYDKIATVEQVDKYIQGSLIGEVTSSLSTTYSHNGVTGDYYYVYDKSEVNYSKGSYVDSVVALYGTYPTNDKSGTYWYVRN